MARFFTDSSSQYLSVSSAPVTTFPFTASAWCYVTSDGQPDAMWSMAENSSGNRFFYLIAAMNGTGDPLRFGHVYGGAAYAQVGTVSLNTWHHCAGIAHSTTSRYAYLDGTESSENTASRALPTLDYQTIGASADTTPFFYFDGGVAEVAVWDVALTQAEIDVLAAGYSPLFVRPASLKSYSKLLGSEDIDLITGSAWTANGSPTTMSHPAIIYPSAQILQFPPAAVAGGNVPHQPFGHPLTGAFRGPI